MKGLSRSSLHAKMMALDENRYLLVLLILIPVQPI